MKTFSLLFLTLFCSLTSFSQTFVQLGTDPSGDNTQTFATDIKSLSYAMDPANDSLWIRLSFHEPTSGDFGAVIGIDTNLVPLDGSNWGGTNTSLKPDYRIYMERNGMFETNIRASSPLTVGPVKVSEDTVNYSVTLHLKLSLYESDRKFNIVAGSGSFDISTSGNSYDDIPNTNYLSVGGSTGIVRINKDATFSLYPNPVKDKLTLELKGDQVFDVKVISAEGKEVYSVAAVSGKQQINVESFTEGIYFLQLKSEAGVQVQKICIR